MNKKKKLIRNSFILILLLTAIASFSTASFTSLSAHKRSERTANYGPSTIIISQRIKNGMLYLCKYDEWFSLSTVEKRFPGLWYAGNQVHGRENSTAEPIVYTWGFSSTADKNTKGSFYGIVNTPQITSIKLETKFDGEMRTLEQKELYDNMFLFYFDEKVENITFTKLIGLDKNSNVVFEKDKPY